MSVIKKIICGLVMMFFITTSVHAEKLTPDSLDIYLTSYHFDDNSGKGYNSENYGVGLNWYVYDYKNFEMSINLGVFNNSFSDRAYWLSTQVMYDVYKTYFYLGVNIRHWETENDTYDDRFLTAYPEIKVKITNDLYFHTILRNSGYIFYMEYEF